MMLYHKKKVCRRLFILDKSAFKEIYKKYVRECSDYPNLIKIDDDFQSGNIYGILGWNNTDKGCLDIFASLRVENGEYLQIVHERHRSRVIFNYLFHKKPYNIRLSGRKTLYMHMKSMYPKLGQIRIKYFRDQGFNTF